MPVKSTPEKRAAQLVERRRTLLLATVSPDGFPRASTTTFVRYGYSYFIYTSALSPHTQDLRANLKADVMFVEDESRSANPFALRRYACPCAVTITERDSDDWLNIMHCFEKKFGKYFDQIRPLRDFTLFELRPRNGRYIEGFGRAYNVGAALEWSQHIGKDDRKK